MMKIHRLPSAVCRLPSAVCRLPSAVWLAACLLILTAGNARAAELRSMNLDIEGWTYAPVEVEGVVTAMVALRDPDQLPAGVIGLYAVDQGDGTWGVKAWTDASYEEIVLYLAALLDQPVYEVAEALIDLPLDWGVLDDPEAVGIAPAPFGDGLLEGDPLEEAVADSDDPMTVLELLELFDYAAVSKVSVAGTTGDPTGGDPCAGDISVDEWLALLQSSFESELAMEGAFVETFTAETGSWYCCIPWRWETITSTAWDCGSWNYDSGPNLVLSLNVAQCETWYRRLATRSQTRDITWLHFDCTATSCIQTRSCASWQYASCTATATPTLGGGYTCAGIPLCTITFPPPCGPSFGPDNKIDQTCSGWWPACP